MAKKQQIVRRITDGDEEFIVVKPDFIENLAAELGKVKRERDALMEDFDKYRIRNIQQTSGVYACDLCKYGGDPYRDEVGKKCPKGCDGMTKWKWRGPCAENGGVEDGK